MLGMSTNESPATKLCKSCGLCCTGHLFTWTKLRSAELNSIQSLGLKVFREPYQRGFSQPCPLWNGVCTIYETPHYPRFCHTYKCKLLKKLLEENTSLSESLTVVQQAMEKIRELESLLHISPKENFRERLVNYIEDENADLTMQSKAKNLLSFFEQYFGVNDFFENT